jgi:hypothetical protein
MKQPGLKGRASVLREAQKALLSEAMGLLVLRNENWRAEWPAEWPDDWASPGGGGGGGEVHPMLNVMHGCLRQIFRGLPGEWGAQLAHQLKLLRTVNDENSQMVEAARRHAVAEGGPGLEGDGFERWAYGLLVGGGLGSLRSLTPMLTPICAGTQRAF